jgi:hypothetical protein
MVNFNSASRATIRRGPDADLLGVRIWALMVATEGEHINYLARNGLKQMDIHRKTT